MSSSATNTHNTMPAQMLELQNRVQENLRRWLPADTTQPQRLHQCMRYSTLSSGKAIRPILMYATAMACNCPVAAVDKAAAALECVHVFSLMHDDLPAMDDDDLRRGKATAHIAFDEATAVLAGDALLNFAFDLLSEPQAHYPAETQVQLMRMFTRAIGHQGMIAGQMIDIENTNNSEDKSLNLDQLKSMHGLKTGALITLPVDVAFIIAQTNDSNLSPQHHQALLQWANNLGLCYQIVDDVLDIESDTETLGKTQGADLDANKSTFPALMGLDESKQMITQLQEVARQELANLPGNTELLYWIQHYIAHRTK